MWVFYALLSAFTASLVAILGKLGLKSIDSTLATTIRSIVMTSFLVLVSLALQKFQGFSLQSFSQKDWLLIILSGLAGATSWLFYFLALKTGLASGVSAIDRLSIVFVVVLASIFLAEVLSWKSVLGSLLIVFGVLLISAK